MRFRRCLELITTEQFTIIWIGLHPFSLPAANTVNRERSAVGPASPRIQDTISCSELGPPLSGLLCTMRGNQRRGHERRIETLRSSPFGSAGHASSQFSFF
eukprot:m.423770 g.423770  ORF g.423770 m.423770 type:complete len:101 (-) comp56663_c0_seq4:193-495(-)